MHRLSIKTLLCLLAPLVLILALAPTALADPVPFSITSFDGIVANQDGTPDTQAGSHPFSDTTTIRFPDYVDSTGSVVPADNVKDINVSLPVGFVGNAQALPQCTQDQLDTLSCPTASQIGYITLYLTFGQGTLPLYNIVPPPSEPAMFGFKALYPDIYMDASVRPTDYGINIDATNISQALPIVGIGVTFWGTPADPSHDSLRACPGQLIVGPGWPSCSSGAPNVPFFTNPTACSGPLTTTVQSDSWSNPGDWKTASFVTHDQSGNPVGIDGCDRLNFSPSLSEAPTTTTADSPTGLAVHLQVPFDESPTGLGDAMLKRVSVVLPAGMSADPSAASGLAGCTSSEIGLGQSSEPSCPDQSKIGAVEITTPLLPDVMHGSLYLAQPHANPFDSLLAVYLTAEADGVLVKVPGQITPDPVTGQLTAMFDNIPQLPFTDEKLTFFDGPRAVLATPEACGSYTIQSTLGTWSSEPDLSQTQSFTIAGGCQNGFKPSFAAGTVNPSAGAFTPFELSFSRPDASQELSGLSVSLPPGALAKLSGVPLCSDSAASAGTCPASTHVGTVHVGSGPGSEPLFLPGTVSLTGPYKGAPYGLAVAVPAIAGPFNLGTVVVRQALHIDPSTAQVTAVSDPFPTILQGIPLRIRRVDVMLNRPGFTMNPTSCAPMAVTGTLTSTLGISAPVSSRFQVGGCASLAFSPKLSMKLTGKGQTRSGDHPSLVSALTQKAGQANMHTARVALPLSLALDPNNSGNVCPYATAQAVHGGAVGCPASTIVGHAIAISPLISKPLTANVYLVQGIRVSHGAQIHTLPSLLIPLRGQIALDLRAQTSVSHGKLVTTFPTIPDAAVSKFTLTINGGHKGILVITGRGRSICGKPQITNATLAGQNGRSNYHNIKMGTPCRALHKKRRGHK